jgi:hypothetical protein
MPRTFGNWNSPVGFLILAVIGSFGTGEFHASDRCWTCVHRCDWPHPERTHHLVCLQASHGRRIPMGYVRPEILIVLANGVLLFSMAAFLLYEPYRRPCSPRDILTCPMLVIPLIGLGVNLISMKLLHSGAGDIVAALIIHLTDGHVWILSSAEALASLSCFGPGAPSNRLLKF